MTVKELKMMLNDMPDDAILLTRSALDASEFEQATAREMTVVSVRGRIMLPRWAYACSLTPDGPSKKAVLFEKKCVPSTKHLKAPMVPTSARPSSISAMQRKPARTIREIIRG